MPRSYPPEVRRQVIELARAGTKVKQLAKTFQMSDATIDNWLKQDRIDRGEAEGATTSQQLELAAARRRIRQLETELVVSRKINEVFLAEGVPVPRGQQVRGEVGDGLPDRVTLVMA
jgi:transposase-like protein